MALANYNVSPDASGERDASAYKVLDVTVASVDSYRVRKAVAGCKDVVVIRCELLCNSEKGLNRATHVRLMIGMQQKNHSDAVRLIQRSVDNVQIGDLVSWRSHLQRCGLRHGG